MKKMTKIYEVVIEKPKITSPFGKRKDPITGKIKMHNGLDLMSKVGNRNLYAIDDGYVQIVHKGTTGYGNYIWVRYPRYDLSLLYAHCASLKLKKGDKVKRGTVVAIEGKSGRATGVHLHLGMTHIGKSTWLNGFLNYIQNIELEENNKYYLLDQKNLVGEQEKKNVKNTFGCSLTENTIIYNIETTNIYKYPIRVIDTQGFGDIRGPKYYEKILGSIKK